MTRMTFSALDLGIIIVYFAAVMVAGLAWLRRGKTADDYFLAGRNLTLPAFVATLVSTWYGGILGVGEFTYLSGISVWLVLAVPYYIFAAVFAFVLAPRIRQAELYTIPDKVAEAYGKGAGVTAAVQTTRSAPATSRRSSFSDGGSPWQIISAFTVWISMKAVGRWPLAVSR